MFPGWEQCLFLSLFFKLLISACVGYVVKHDTAQHSSSEATGFESLIHRVHHASKDQTQFSSHIRAASAEYFQASSRTPPAHLGGRAPTPFSPLSGKPHTQIQTLQLLFKTDNEIEKYNTRKKKKKKEPINTNEIPENHQATSLPYAHRAQVSSPTPSSPAIRAATSAGTSPRNPTCSQLTFFFFFFFSSKEKQSNDVRLLD